jgi:hypothetical protein
MPALTSVTAVHGQAARAAPRIRHAHSVRCVVSPALAAYTAVTAVTARISRRRRLHSILQRPAGSARHVLHGPQQHLHCVAGAVPYHARRSRPQHTRASMLEPAPELRPPRKKSSHSMAWHTARVAAAPRRGRTRGPPSEPPRPLRREACAGPCSAGRRRTGRKQPAKAGRAEAFRLQNGAARACHAGMCGLTRTCEDNLTRIRTGHPGHPGHPSRDMVSVRLPGRRMLYSIRRPEPPGYP